MMYPELWDAETESRVRKEAKNLDPQFTGEEVRFCKRCVVSNQRPRITFDDGVCSACRFADRKLDIDWIERARDLDELLSEHRWTGHDVVVPTSGGKDSAMVAHRLKHEHNMTPMAATWAPMGYTESGYKNFEAFIQSGFDCQVGYANGLTHRKLSRLALEFYGDHFLPFIWGQLNFPLHVAKDRGIDLIMLGENGESEYGGDSSADDRMCWERKDWDRIYMKGASASILFEVGRDLGVFSPDDFHNLSPFYSPPLDFWPTVAWFSYFRKWHPQSNYYYAVENTGFEPNDIRSTGTYSKYASIDDRFDDPHYYLGYIKYGLGRATSDAAHEIRDGDITREEGVELVRKYDGEFPERHQAEFYQYLGIDTKHFIDICNRFRPDHVWSVEKDQHGFTDWELKHKVWEET
jgi:N-acetyl sugar amidotransferase